MTDKKENDKKSKDKSEFIKNKQFFGDIDDFIFQHQEIKKHSER